MRLVKNKKKIPAPEPDSAPDSSSPDSPSPGASFIPDEPSPEADSVPEKLGNYSSSPRTLESLKNCLNLGADLFLEIWFLKSLFACLDYTAKSTS